MTWPQALALITLFVALGKFVDSYHRRSQTQSRIVEWLRSLLVATFLKLDQIRPIQIARVAFRVPIWVQIFTILVSCILILFAVFIVSGAVLVLGNLPFPLEVAFVPVCFVILLQVLVFICLRLLARYANDIVATLGIFLLPIFIVSAIAIPVSAAAAHPGLSGLWLAIFVLVTLVSGLVPILVVLAIGIGIMLLKYFTLLMRWIAMRVAEGASNPQTSPFVYFAALASLGILGVKTLGEFL